MKIEIKGPIVPNDDQKIYEWLGIEATSPGLVSKALGAAESKPVEVYINSPGGSVFDASEIYTMLREYKNTVVVKVVGLAASAASVIAMAGTNVFIAPTAQIMIHNVSTVARGDYRSMAHTMEVLKNANETIANAYMAKTKLSKMELLRMMDEETWLTPGEAINKGFADAVLFETSRDQGSAQSATGLTKTGTLPSEGQSAKLTAQLELLRLRGANHI